MEHQEPACRCAHQIIPGERDPADRLNHADVFLVHDKPRPHRQDVRNAGSEDQRPTRYIRPVEPRNSNRSVGARLRSALIPLPDAADGMQGTDHA